MSKTNYAAKNESLATKHKAHNDAKKAKVQKPNTKAINKALALVEKKASTLAKVTTKLGIFTEMGFTAVKSAYKEYKKAVKAARKLTRTDGKAPKAMKPAKKALKKKVAA